MKKLIFVLCAALLLASCAATRYAPSEQSQQKDSTYTSQHYIDSLVNRLARLDSVYNRDSIYVYVKGDTVTRYVEKTRYRYQLQRDTILKTITRVDTVFIERRDSIKIVQPVEVERRPRWHETLFIHIGRLCSLSFILWILFLYLKRKF